MLLVMYVDDLFLSQGKYTVEILCRFGMVDCKSINTPMDSNFRKIHETNIGSNLVEPTLYSGSLMYLIHSRTNIFYEINIFSQFMSDPRRRH